jgi:hypothetical protein
LKKVPKPIRFLAKIRLRINMIALAITCRFPRVKPNLLATLRFIKLQGSVPKFTSINKERNKPIPRIEIIIIGNFTAKWGTKNCFFRLFKSIVSSIVQMNKVTIAYLLKD